MKINQAEKRALNQAKELYGTESFTSKGLVNVNYRTLLNLEKKGYLTGKFSNQYQTRVYNLV